MDFTLNDISCDACESPMVELVVVTKISVADQSIGFVRKHKGDPALREVWEYSQLSGPFNSARGT